LVRIALKACIRNWHGHCSYGHETQQADPMRMPSTFLSAVLLCAPLAFAAGADSAAAAGLTVQSMAAAQAEGYSNSAAFNSGFGMAPGQENAPISGSERDANGNLVITNGVMSGAGSFSQQSGLTQTGAAAGAGTASATAIGNSLNVTVSGAWNTVIVNSQQTNTGNQSANASLNGNLKF
jgi:holdfast attachment protein HfaA